MMATRPSSKDATSFNSVHYPLKPCAQLAFCFWGPVPVGCAWPWCSVCFWRKLRPAQFPVLFGCLRSPLIALGRSAIGVPKAKRRALLG